MRRIPATAIGAATGRTRSLHYVRSTILGRGLNTLNSVVSAMRAAARQTSRTRLAAMGITAVVLVAVVVFVPLPTAVQLRDWAASVGPWLPLAFLGAHVVVTVLPFPRTAFTLAAGLLFGPVLGIAIATIASTLSAVIALVVVRALGWQLSNLISHPRVDSLNARLRARGWPAVLSLRLIPAVPFSVLNYAVGASSVGIIPYSLATLVGLMPGTAAVVLLGDAMTGSGDSLLVLVSVCTAAVGITGLVYEIRRHHPPRHSGGEL